MLENYYKKTPPPSIYPSYKKTQKENETIHVFSSAAQRFWTQF